MPGPPAIRWDCRVRTPTRKWAVLVLIVALVVGLAVQPFRELPGTDAVGSAMYAAAAVGVWALLLPHRGALLPGLIGTVLACGVELWQLSELPQRIAATVPGAGLVLGGVFDPMDLLWLVAGGLLATLALAR
ncbi:hypothetical protein CGZ97_04075 [Enemella evansiae]|nr:hypothetical protein CGZ97_04075 [Enemella evansiae]